MASSKNFLILLPHIWLTYSSFNLAFLGLTLAFKTLGVAYILLSPELGAQVSFLSHRSRFITGHHFSFERDLNLVALLHFCIFLFLLRIFSIFLSKLFKLFKLIELVELFELFKLFKFIELVELFELFEHFKLFELFKLVELFELVELVELSELFKLFKLCPIFRFSILSRATD